MTTTNYTAHVPATDFDTDTDVIDAFTRIANAYNVHVDNAYVASRTATRALVAFTIDGWDASRLTHGARLRLTRA